MSSDLMTALQPKLFVALVCAVNIVPCWLLRRETSGVAVRLLNRATLAFGVGLPLLLFKDWLPRMPAVIVGNMLLLAAMGLLWQVVSRLDGRAADGRLALPAPLAWLCCWLLPAFRDELDLRIAVAAGLAVLLVGLAAADILRAGAGGMPRRLLLGTGILHVAVDAVRLALAASHDRFATHPVWTTVIQLNTLAFMMLWPALCTVLLNRESLDAETERGRRDELSGLLNRRGVLRELALAGPGTLLMFDIDHFKRINDRFGHAAGDAAIVSFGLLAQRVLGGLPGLGRIGGEEFVVLVPGSNPALALAIAERMRTGFASLELPDGIRATVSVGVAVPVAGEPIDMQLARADRALYRAKRLGRDRIELCAGQPQPSAPDLERRPEPVADQAPAPDGGHESGQAAIARPPPSSEPSGAAIPPPRGPSREVMAVA